MRAYDSITAGLQDLINYTRGNMNSASEISTITENTNLQKLRPSEQDEPQVVEVFEEFKFNPEGSWMDIYRVVIDGIANKYWFYHDRKDTIENKVYEFYKKFKHYPSVATAYTHFLRSDRLFED